MLIIVEGIDRVGKTTLCEMLSKSFGIKIFKHDSKLFKLDKMDNDNETDKAIKIYEICKLLMGLYCWIDLIGLILYMEFLKEIIAYQMLWII